MLRILFIIISLALAAPLAAATLTPKEFRALLAAGAFDEAEAALDALWDEVRAGTVSYSDQRSVYAMAETTDPVIVKAIAAWNMADPTSVHARAALMFSNLHRGWLFRGPRVARHTRPEAFEAYHALIGPAAEIAAALAEEASDFVPGSDGMMQAQMQFGNRESILYWTDRIMAVTPNRQTLDLALMASTPQWGGSADEILALCERFADMAQDWGPFTVLDCKVDAVFRFWIDEGAALAWAQEQLDACPGDRFIQARLRDLTRHRPDRDAFIALLPRLRSIASKFDKKIYWNYLAVWVPPDEPDPEAYEQERYQEMRKSDPIMMFMEKEWGRRARSLFAALELDPLNPNLIADIAEVDFFEPSPGIPPSGAWLKEHLLAAAEYGRWNPDFWLLLGRASQSPLDPDRALEVLEYYENAVRSSVYEPSAIDPYFAYVDMWMTNTELMIEQGRNEFRGAVIDPVALRNDMACPWVRAARLRALWCEGPEGNGHASCHARGWPYGPMLAALKRASDEGLCPELLDAPIAALALD